MSDVFNKAKKAKEVSLFLTGVTTGQKNSGLKFMAENLMSRQDYILQENALDLKNGEKAGMSKALLDRLALNVKRIENMAEGLKVLIDLPDPVGEVIEGSTRPNGLQIIKKRVSIGVIGIIYEARPNVTVDAAGLTLKSSNAVILRGSSSAINSNKAIVQVLNDALSKAGFPQGTIGLIEDTSRESVQDLITCKEFVDLVIPRGGAGLIETVINNATVPSIETGVGNCHVYVDKDARKEIIVPIVINSKVQRPSVCNAAETLLLHEDIADEMMPLIIRELKKNKVEIFGCPKTQKFDKEVKVATEEEYKTEFLDYKIAVKIVKDIKEAVKHINTYGTLHTEAVISENYTTLELFKSQVDAAAIMVNTSTRFTDGFEFGFGAEIGISTQKMHARGPMGLRELTTYKYIVEGNGQIRG
ncbi:MAG: glutamate-5-semialdehyde dehydrogenase [Candidatus Margulisbacteria bacterium]|nr:glutamate-5-semialdehyde dehydrogenase [Candidatus Margulisiibacteriota bacterium]